VPARLNADGRAEFLTESEWKLAPRPLTGGFGSGIQNNSRHNSRTERRWTERVGALNSG
jgi:hypothetical protein